jgi:Bifunctional DNA primase/polymerase, N-terminal
MTPSEHDPTAIANGAPEPSGNGDGNSLYKPTIEGIFHTVGLARKNGVNPIPPTMDGVKRPDLSAWEEFEHSHVNDIQVSRWWGSHTGWGAVCGTISGGKPGCSLCCLDFDDDEVYQRYRQAAADAGLAEILERAEAGYLDLSPGGGRHVLARVPGEWPTTKLAERPAVDAEGNPVLVPGTNRQKIKTLIETKCEGGFVILAPSYGRVHPTGKPYVQLRGGLDTIAEITPEEWQALCDLAFSFDESPIPPAEKPARAKKRAGAGAAGDVLPGEDFAARTNWDDQLRDEGWTKVFTRGDVTYYRRPDKGIGVSASLNYGGSDTFYCWSTSTNLEPRKSYSKFGFYAKVKHGGDFSKAAKALYAEGYGTRREKGRSGGEPPTDEEWEAYAQEQADDHAKMQAATLVFANYAKEFIKTDEGKKAIQIPLRAHELDEALRELAGHWPKRVDRTLFLQGSDYSPIYLETPTQLMAWLDGLAQVDWAKGQRCITQERFHARLRMTAECFDTIETAPHFPPLPRTYYMHPQLPKPSGKLKELIDKFSPGSSVDRELIKALVLTLFWGGTPGTRPAFLITGPDNDTERGRGVGKTKLLDIIAEELAGGAISVSPTDQIADVKTRMLSEDARQQRVARLDNLKTYKFSYADLEDLITSPVISGRALYLGEGRRPNTIVWCITLNGASLSKDMAQRVIIIKLKRPTFSATWEENVRTFAREHRWDILADVGACLEAEADAIITRTRWASWEQGVLSHVSGYAACQDIIVSRQAAVDDDDEERDIVAAVFRDRIRPSAGDPDKAHVFIPSWMASQWLQDATQEKRPTNRASSYLLGLGIPELRKSSDGGQRGWRWKGEGSPADAPATPIDQWTPSATDSVDSTDK